MEQTELLTLREIGVLVCYNTHKALFGRYPQSPEDLSKVTASVLPQHRFDDWDTWFYQYTGEAKG